MTVVGAGADNAAIATDRNDKQAIFKSCAPHNAQAENAKDLGVVMPMYNLIE